MALARLVSIDKHDWPEVKLSAGSLRQVSHNQDAQLTDFLQPSCAAETDRRRPSIISSPTCERQAMHGCELPCRISAVVQLWECRRLGIVPCIGAPRCALRHGCHTLHRSAGGSRAFNFSEALAETHSPRSGAPRFAEIEVEEYLRLRLVTMWESTATPYGERTPLVRLSVRFATAGL